MPERLIKKSGITPEAINAGTVPVDYEIRQLEAILQAGDRHVLPETHGLREVDVLKTEVEKLDHPDVTVGATDLEYVEPKASESGVKPTETTTVHELAMNGGYLYEAEPVEGYMPIADIDNAVSTERKVKNKKQETPEPLSKAERLEVFKYRLAKFGRTALMAAVIAANVVPSVSAAYTGEPMIAARNVTDLLTGADVAPVPNSIDVQVDTLAGTPTDPELLEIMEEYQGEEFSEHYYDYVQEKAAENGLHISDSAEYIDQLQTAETLDDLVKILNDYGATIGLKFTAHTSVDVQDIGVGVDPLSPENYSVTPELIDKFSAIMGSLQYVPREVIEFADIKEVRIVDSLSPFGFDAAGEASMWTGNMYVELNNMDSGGYELLMHELAHFLDYRMSGSSLAIDLRDGPYNDFNTSDFDYTTQYGTTSDGSDGVAEAYGTTNVFEDKATMMESMINGLDSDLLNSDDPIVQGKYRLLLSRLEQHVPGMLGYLMDVSIHNSGDLYS